MTALTARDQLIDQVLNQIMEDVDVGDVTAIEELIRNCDDNDLRAYLPLDKDITSL